VRIGKPDLGLGLVILSKRTPALFGALRFIWNATRGHRLTPWRSEFLRWRVETYSGKPAETLKTRDVLGFVWDSRWELLSFLAWTGRLERETRKRT
jgi:hypothetical protein